MIQFDDERTSPAVIKVIGVGGAGSNAVNRMIRSGLESVDFIVINTDEQALKTSFATNKVVIGKKITNGLGAGGDPEIGLKAAKEDRDKIAKLLEGADMIFITAGMGGGTGTGAAPVIAEIAKSLGALTVGVVTVPFSFEGKVREKNAKMGLDALKQNVDTHIVIKNDQIFEVIDPHVPVNVALKIIDDILLNAVRGISDIINKPGIINVDFADVKNIMKSSGEAVLGFGEGLGENKVKDAVNQAINNILLDNSDIRGATGVLLNICGGEDLSFFTWKEVSELITREVDPDANKIIGLMIDPELKDKVKVTVIATGFKRRNTHNVDYGFSMKQPKSSSIHQTRNTLESQQTQSLKVKEIQKEPYPGKKNLNFVKNRPDFSLEENINNHNITLEDERKSSSLSREENYTKEENLTYKEQFVEKRNLQDLILTKRNHFSTQFNEDLFELDYEILQIPAYVRKEKK